ncbi:hypothetical protein FMN50_25700 [Rhodobacterales bacterium]|nr:hypothetical protein FMN50_25700 [Rhodobacterales bacterium]
MNLGFTCGFVVNSQNYFAKGSMVTFPKIMVKGGERVSIPIYYPDRDQVAGNYHVKTDGNGFFLMPFRWDPLHLGNVIEYAEASLTISEGRFDDDGHNVGYGAPRKVESELYKFIDWSAGRDGLLPEVRKLDGSSHRITPHVEIPHEKFSKLRDEFINKVKPSPEYYGLLSFKVIYL